MKHFSITNKKLLLALLLPTFTILFVMFGTIKVSAIESTNNIPSTYSNIGQPYGMVMMDNGNIWYVDRINVRIVLYDPIDNVILRTVGRLGTQEGEFIGSISTIVKDSEENLYVLADCRIYKLDSNGGLLGDYELHSQASCGNTAGISYDSYTDSIFVADYGTGTVRKYNTNIEYIDTLGSQFALRDDSCHQLDDTDPGFCHAPNGQFSHPWQMTTDKYGRIYVADPAENRIEVFSSSYIFLYQIKTWADVGGTTSFVNLQGIVVLSNGRILALSEHGAHVVEEFDYTGHHISTLTGGDYRFSFPQYIIKDSSDNFYVSSPVLNSVAKYSSAGVFDSVFGNNKFENEKLYYPTGIAYKPDDYHLYVMNGGQMMPNIKEYDENGDYVGIAITTAQLSYNDQPDARCLSIAFDSAGKLYVSCTYEVWVFSKSGNDWSLDYKTGHEFIWPGRVAFDDSDNMYIPIEVGTDESKVLKFIIDGETGHYVYDSDFITGLFGPSSVDIDSVSGNLVISDTVYVKEYSSAGAFIQNIGDNYLDGNNPVSGEYKTPLCATIDQSTHSIYVSDGDADYINKIIIYTPDGEGGFDFDSESGLRGTGQMQFMGAFSSAINPSTGTISVADTSNGRVQSFFADGMTKIINLIPSANVVRRDEGHLNQSLSNTAWNPTGLDAVPARLMFGDYVVADFIVDLTVTRDWSAVNVQTLPGDSKSLVVNLNSIDAPGIIGDHSLYISRYSNQTFATVCPNATKLFGNVDVAVVEGCTDGYVLTDGVDSDISPVTIGTKNYWKIDNLSGTGAFSTLFETGFELSDVMTRQQVSTASNHEITFGTTNDLNHVGDTITLGFSSDWDLSTIHFGDGDISLYRGSTELTLGDVAADDTWVVTFGTDPNQIVFTAPQNATGSDQSILAGSTIKVLINNNALVNPSNVDSYEITMRLLSNDEANNENGSVEIPIVDSDTVNINGYVLSNLFFDLDTGTGEVPTWPAGGNGTVVNCEANGDYACLAYADGPATENYTVDLGHLAMAYANKSNSNSVEHTNGDNKVINSIYFDFSTNAASGGVITYKSLFGELRGPAHNADASLDLDIPTTDGNTNIVAGTSGYGIQLATAPVYKSVGTGTQTVNCGNTSSTYCIMGAINPTTGVNEQLSLPIYTVTGPIELGRGKIDVAAAIDGTVVPGSYTDQVTFIATSIY